MCKYKIDPSAVYVAGHGVNIEKPELRYVLSLPSMILRTHAGCYEWKPCNWENGKCCGECWRDLPRLFFSGHVGLEPFNFAKAE
jgi:hypothetical protein